MNLVLFGPPGSGKGTQAERLRDRFRLRHISTGDLLRDAVTRETELGKQVQSVLAAGLAHPAPRSASPARWCSAEQ